ncbi:MAG: hypothetical protein J6U54_11320 [Clostridiales bacterium]|nr:hypothetical protein [Clostridiales bacterium]
MSRKGLQIISLIATAVGMGAGVVSQAVGEKQQELIIEEKVAEKTKEQFAEILKNKGKS